MRAATCVGSVLLVLPVAGCTLGHGVPAREPITHVQADWGRPDVISDESGDLARFYAPTSRPADEWPPEVPRTFWYLDRSVAVTFVRGRAVAARAIRDDERSFLVGVVR